MINCFELKRNLVLLNFGHIKVDLRFLWIYQKKRVGQHFVTQWLVIFWHDDLSYFGIITSSVILIISEKKLSLQEGVKSLRCEVQHLKVFSFSLKIHALSIQLQIVHLKHTTEHSLFMFMTINVTERSQSWFRGMLDFVEDLSYII